MARQTQVNSIDALRLFRAALLRYAEELQEALDTLSLESQRTVDWIQLDRLAYWPAETRRATDQLNEALSALQMKQMTCNGRDKPAATEEKQRVAQARQRLRLTEEKQRITKRAWQHVHHQSEEYRGTLGKLAQLIECDVPAAVAALDRMIAALEKYVSISTASTRDMPTSSPQPNVSDSETTPIENSP